MSKIRALFLSSLVLATMLPAKGSGQTALSFSTVDVPGATQTVVTDIDGSGNLVGFYVSGDVSHGFRKVAGNFVSINFQGATGTWPSGIDLNNSYIVGWYTDSKSVSHGFKLASGTFKTINVPGAVWTRALSVNSMGTIVGAYADNAGKIHGFLDDRGNGVFTTLDYPEATLTEINHIVNLRYMAGMFIDSSGVEHGVQGADGMLGMAINFPGAKLTTATGVNNAVDIVGYYSSSNFGPFHGYLLTGGQFHTINFPDAIDTRCNSISDALEIVGRYTDRLGKIHGFFAK